MQNHLISRALCVVALSMPFAALGCTADIHDNVVNISASLEMSTTADVDHMHAGDPLAVTITVDGVDADGHFQIYMDDTDSTPLVVTADLHVSLTIPADVDLGNHDVICRFHKHDNTATDLEFHLAITVE